MPAKSIIRKLSILFPVATVEWVDEDNWNLPTKKVLLSLKIIGVINTFNRIITSCAFIEPYLTKRELLYGLQRIEYSK